MITCYNSITSKPFYLMDRNGKELENADRKYELAKALLTMLNKDNIIVSENIETCPAVVPTNAIIIVFMG